MIRPHQIILMFLLGAALSGGCGRGDAAVQAAAIPSPATSSGTATAEALSSAWAPVRSAEGAELLEVPAQVLGSATARADVMPAFRAQVVQVLVEPGQDVAIGAPLLVVRMPDVVRAAGAYVAAGLRMTAYGQRRDQLQALRAEGLARLSDLAEVAAALSEASAAQREAQSVLLGAGLSPGDAASLADGGGKVTLRSPIAGVVTAVSASIGQLVEPGSAALARIAGAGETRVEARLPLLEPVSLRYELVTAQGITPLKLLRRAPVLEPRDGMAQSWFLPQGPAGLLPGQSGRLRVRVDGRRGAGAPLWLLPSRALRLGGDHVTVLRRRGGASQAVRIAVAASAAGHALVRPETSGDLALGDSVAIAAQLMQTTPGGAP